MMPLPMFCDTQVFASRWSTNAGNQRTVPGYLLLAIEVFRGFPRSGGKQVLPATGFRVCALADPPTPLANGNWDLFVQLTRRVLVH